MRKQIIEVKDSFIMINILKQDSIDAINNYLKKLGSGSQYTKKIVGKRARVIRIRKKFKFFDRLMREKPGFDKLKDNA